MYSMSSLSMSPSQLNLIMLKSRLHGNKTVQQTCTLDPNIHTSHIRNKLNTHFLAFRFPDLQNFTMK